MVSHQKNHRAGKEGINQSSNQRTKVTLKEVDGSIVEMGVSVYRTTISHTLHTGGLQGRVAEENKADHLTFAKRYIVGAASCCGDGFPSTLAGEIGQN